MQPNEPYVSEAERMRQQLRDTLTRRELLENWWHYHWHPNVKLKPNIFLRFFRRNLCYTAHQLRLSAEILHFPDDFYEATGLRTVDVISGGFP